MPSVWSRVPGYEVGMSLQENRLVAHSSLLSPAIPAEPAGHTLGNTTAGSGARGTGIKVRSTRLVQEPLAFRSPPPASTSSREGRPCGSPWSGQHGDSVGSSRRPKYTWTRFCALMYGSSPRGFQTSMGEGTQHALVTNRAVISL